MAARTFVLRQIVTVRVGAEVEITTFYEPKRSAWDGAIKGHEGHVTPDEALVRDLDVECWLRVEPTAPDAYR